MNNAKTNLQVVEGSISVEGQTIGAPVSPESKITPVVQDEMPRSDQATVNPSSQISSAIEPQAVEMPNSIQPQVQHPIQPVGNADHIRLASEFVRNQNPAVITQINAGSPAENLSAIAESLNQSTPTSANTEQADGADKPVEG